MNDNDDDPETAAIINVALREANQLEISEAEKRRARRHRVGAWSVFAVLFSASVALGIYGDPDNPLSLIAWFGCAVGMLLALAKAGIFHSMFRN